MAEVIIEWLNPDDDKRNADDKGNAIGVSLGRKLSCMFSYDDVRRDGSSIFRVYRGGVAFDSRDGPEAAENAALEYARSYALSLSEGSEIIDRTI